MYMYVYVCICMYNSEMGSKTPKYKKTVYASIFVYMYVYVCKNMYMYEYAIICINMPAHTSYASLFQCFWAGFKLMRALNLEVGWWWA